MPRGLRGPRATSEIAEGPKDGRNLTFGFQPDIWLQHVMWVATHMLAFLWFPGFLVGLAH